MRHKKVPLQTVISLKTINKSSTGNSEETVGYEMEQDKPQEFLKKTQARVDKAKAKRTLVKPHLNAKQCGKLWAVGTGH